MSGQLALLPGQETSAAVFARVVSGGQTGVDVAALRAAKSMGVPTGGRMPLGFKTLRGPQPGYAALYGVEEDSSPEYPQRTLANVRASDATLRIARDFRTAGELCTKRAVERYGRPHHDVRAPFGRASGQARARKLQAAVRWVVGVRIAVGRPIVLNVAGNSEESAPGIEVQAEDFLREFLSFLVAREVAA